VVIKQRRRTFFRLLQSHSCSPHLMVITSEGNIRGIDTHLHERLNVMIRLKEIEITINFRVLEEKKNK